MQKKALIINVLSPVTYSDCHIPGSINVPLADLESQVADWDKGQHIIVYCASYECGAGSRAWHLLNNLGFKNVTEYEGGMNEWLYKGYRVEGTCTADYLKKPITKKVINDPRIKTITHDALQKLILNEYSK